MSDPIAAGDIQAYIDGQLDPLTRLEVQEHLSLHPELAAQVMADLRGRDELRLALLHVAPASPALAAAAAQLTRRLARRQFSAAALRGLAALLLIGLGWFLHLQVSMLQFGSGPERIASAFVADAHQAYRMELMRAAMASQPDGSRHDAAEIMEKTQIAMPKLSPGWQITDVQVFPSREGPGIEATISAGPLGTVSLFAARADRSAVIAPTMSRTDSETAIHWQTGRLAYSLIGTGSSGPLALAADAMFSARN